MSTDEGQAPDPLRGLPGDAAQGRERCETARRFLAPGVPAALPGPTGSGGSPEVLRHDSISLDAFKNWTPEAQERALELIRQRSINPWKPFYCERPLCDGNPHGNWLWPHGRGDQRPPPMHDPSWLTWLLMGGRGGGKTRTGSEAIHRIVKRVPRVHLVAPTGPDLRDTMVEGVSGLQATAPPDFIPQWEPSKKRLTWPNGAVAIGFSGEEPDRLRGPQCYFAWIDEPAHMPAIGGDGGVWDNLLFGLRLGKQEGWQPRIIATTTPKPTKWMKDLVKDPKTRINTFSTYANLANLADTFRDNVLKKYEGTRLGQQELHGVVLEDVEGSLWKAEWFKYVDPEKLSDLHLDRIVVGIDPAGSANRKSDETGIVVVGIKGDVLYVLADYTDKYTPDGWARAAVRAYEKFSADALVAERNYGGDMVRSVLESNGAKDIKIEEVISRRGKAIRAEPIAALYEKSMDDAKPDRVFHVRGTVLDLESELTTWVPGQTDSPNRLDAMVHAATSLGKKVMPAEVANNADLANIPIPTLRRAG